ncbi:hypothetical protein GACE_2275 [Geoglobus acetivorans]|uniref:Uncharacterized protein n=1 Tax=Geoglobus acetivorans TaxID=565033 RepID=A0A0A7GCQ4_GEOAI|nr:hypothetical protein GACE_2275 [Geoglobus acetivorans]
MAKISETEARNSSVFSLKAETRTADNHIDVAPCILGMKDFTK